jgi:hypothetical protein
MRKIPTIYKWIIGAALTFIFVLGLCLAIALFKLQSINDALIEKEVKHRKQLKKKRLESLARTFKYNQEETTKSKKIDSLIKKIHLQDSIDQLPLKKHHEKINNVVYLDAYSVADSLTNR